MSIAILKKIHFSLLFFLFLNPILSLLQISNQKCLSFFDNKFERQFQRQEIESCLALNLREGKIVNLQKYQNLIEKNNLISIYEAEIKRLVDLQKLVVLGQSSCSPVTKWAQNETHIFISMKLAHSWGSPPCLHTLNSNFWITKQKFEYTNICVVSQQKVLFNLSLELYGEPRFDPHSNKTLEVDVKKDGVGIYSVVISKQINQIWPYLDKKHTSYPLWSQIIERYPQQHKKYELLLTKYKSRGSDIINQVNLTTGSKQHSQLD